LYLKKVFKKKIYLFSVVLFIFFIYLAHSVAAEQSEMITWDRTFGGSNTVGLTSLIQVEDRGYAIAGWASSKDSRSQYFWFIRLDEYGNLLWDRIYGESIQGYAFSLIQTNDGGYAVAGVIRSQTDNKQNAWLLKLDSQGNILWEKTYGGSAEGWALSIIQTTDGNFALAGWTKSKGASEMDAWVIKLDYQGNLLWDRTYGGSGFESARSIIQTTDGGYALAGVTASNEKGSNDFWIIKLDELGNEGWFREYKENVDHGNPDLIQTSDGGYILALSTTSKGAGSLDFLVIKLDSQGNLLWDLTYGGNSWDKANSIIQTIDGGYAVAGGTYSKGSGTYDLWLIRLDINGNFLWDRTYGEINSYYGKDCFLIKTTDGGLVLAGEGKSKGDRTQDIRIFKVNEQGNLLSSIESLKEEVEIKDAVKNTETTDDKSEVSTETSTTMTQTIPVPSFDSYQWEVGLPGFTKPGDITYFGTTKPGTVQLLNPSLLNPSNGETLLTGDISFSWNPVSNATKYQFVLYNSQGEIALDTPINSTSITVALGIEETITWKVRAGDNSGNWGPWSSIWSLNVKSTTDISTDTSSQISETTHLLQGSLNCPDKAGYACTSCTDAPGYVNHFKGFNILTTQQDCYAKLTYNNGDYIGNQNDCEVIIKGEKWLGLEDKLGTTGLVKEIHKEEFDFKPYNQFVARTMNLPQDGYQYEFADEGREFRLYLSGNVSEAFQAVPWQKLSVEIKNKETNKVFTYKFEKGIFPRAYAWSNGVANYGQCVWWAAKRWVEEVDSRNLFPFYPSSPQMANVRKIESDPDYQPKRFDILIDYIPGGQPGHYGFVEKVDEDLVYISQFNFIEPGEVYNHVPRFWNGNPKSLYYSLYPHNEYYFKYYYRSENK